MKTLQLYAITLLLVFKPLYAHINVPAVEEDARQQVTKIYQNPAFKKLDSVDAKINWLSGYFLSKPYVLGALGEGVNGEYDQYPRFRVDGFDCLTFVETTLALSLSHNPLEFEKTLARIRYHNGQIDYFQRNHFTSLDWNAHNANLVKDITPDFGKVLTSETLKYQTGYF